MGSRGIALGLVVASTLLLWFSVFEIHQWEAIYKDMASGSLPATTQFILDSKWRIGAPIGAGLLLWLLSIRLPVRLWPYVVAFVVILAAGLFTYTAIREPLWALAGTIRAD